MMAKWENRGRVAVTLILDTPLVLKEERQLCGEGDLTCGVEKINLRGKMLIARGGGSGITLIVHHQSWRK